MEMIMGDGFKGFIFGLGATCGVILGLYAGFRAIEFIGYAQAKREFAREKAMEEQLEQARREGSRTIEHGTSTPAAA
jgi:hypothetical protein